MVDYTCTLEALRKNSFEDIAAILADAACMVAAMHDRGTASHSPAQVEREIAACFDELKAKMLTGGFLNDYKREDGSIGWLV